MQASAVTSAVQPGHGDMRELRVVALTSYPDEAACTRFRIAQFIGLLASHGARVTLLPFLTTRAFHHLYDPRQWFRTSCALLAGLLRRIAHIPTVVRADVVFIQREAMLLGPPILEWLAVRVARRPLVLDLDDATYLEPAGSVYGRLSKILKTPRKTDRLIDWSTLVVCGNEWIAQYVRGRGREAVVVPTIVNTAVFVPRTDDGNERDVPIVGWVGSHSTTDYFKSIIPALERLGREFRFRVRIVGAAEPISIKGVELETLPWRRDREVHDFQMLDVGVYPLPDDVWATAKSGLKAIEYLASGVPFVASPVGVVGHLGSVGQTHLLARTSDEWHDALATLLRDREKRRAMGVAARAYALQHYSVEQVARILDGLLRGVSQPARRSHI